MIIKKSKATHEMMDWGGRVELGSSIRRIQWERWARMQVWLEQQLPIEKSSHMHWWMKSKDNILLSLITSYRYSQHEISISQLESSCSLNLKINL
jgi:hypothetical protein